jgi:hypothetical protein
MTTATLTGESLARMLPGDSPRDHAIAFGVH